MDRSIQSALRNSKLHTFLLLRNRSTSFNNHNFTSRMSKIGKPWAQDLKPAVPVEARAPPSSDSEDEVDSKVISFSLLFFIGLFCRSSESLLAATATVDALLSLLHLSFFFVLFWSHSLIRSPFHKNSANAHIHLPDNTSINSVALTNQQQRPPPPPPHYRMKTTNHSNAPSRSIWKVHWLQCRQTMTRRWQWLEAATVVLFFFWGQLFELLNLN